MQSHFDHRTLLQSALAAGEDFVRTMNPAATHLSLRRLAWPLDDERYFPFDRVQQVFYAQSALDGFPDREPSLQLLHSMQLALGWDRIVHHVADTDAARYQQRALPRTHDLARLFELPADAQYLALEWPLQGQVHHGVWLLRDRHPTTGTPVLLIHLVGAPDDSRQPALVVPGDVVNWDVAVQHTWGIYARDHGIATGPDSAAQMTRHIAAASAWESLIALLYDVCEPRAVRARGAAAAIANQDAHGFRSVPVDLGG